MALGPYMAWVFSGRMRVLAPVERGLLRAAGVDGAGQRWTGCAAGVLAFNAAGFVLLPGAIVIGLILIWQGMPQTLAGSITVTTLEGVQQLISQGPVASQAAIKMLGTNGGGFFNVNAAHPFENPSALANLVQIFAILVIPAAFPFFFGLMVGRTPEWLGKKIEAREMKLAALTLLVMPVGVLVLAVVSILTGHAAGSVQDAGPHGLSELIYAYSSGTANNGSAFAGFGANTLWHNTMIGLAMMIGRWGYIIPVLAIAGSLAAKPRAEAMAGTFPTHGPAFTILLVATILIVGALTFLPVLALGPIAEHVSIGAGQTF